MKTLLGISFVILLLFLFYPGKPWATSKNLFKKGTSGFDVSGSFSSSNDITFTGISPFYSFNSIVDFGVTMERESIDKNKYQFELSAIAVAPFIGIQLLKQTSEIPVSFTIKADYEFDNFQSSWKICSYYGSR